MIPLADVEVREKMSIVPVANRSFLHGDRKPSPTSEKILYATLDSLALKRATLPLQLLPINDDSNATTKATNESMKQGKIHTEMIAKRSSFKVDATCPSSKQHAKYLVVASPLSSSSSSSSSSKPDSQETRLKVTAIEPNLKKDIACLQRNWTNNSDIEDTLIRDSASETDIFEETYAGEIARNSSYCCYIANDVAASSTNDKNGSPSDDYEKIESVIGTDACCNFQAETNDDEESLENEEDTSCTKNVFVKSKSTNDLASKSYSDMRLSLDGQSLVGTFSDGKLAKSLLFSNEFPNCGKKKKHFAKNVLHFVPEYLVKGQKGKRKQKEKGIPSRSLNSLKISSSVDTKIGINSNGRYRSKSLSREELKYLKISSPTNFVHIASATNPNLVSNENTIRFSLGQVVITHEQKCATLPLLVATNYENSMAEKRSGQSSSSIVAESTSFDATSSVVDKSNEKAKRRNDGFNVETLKRQLLSELQTRSAKLLELSQQVKTDEYRANIREGSDTTYELAYEPCTELPANSSFLWSNRTKNFLLENTRTIPNENTENIEDAVGEVYDDVGPLNLNNQEDDYDDVGTPDALHVTENRISESSTAFQDSDDIYDDVMGPSCAVTDFKDNEIEICDNEAKQESSELFVTNEYSSVDENIDVSNNDQDVYDDVGLPSEERVNSLYTGSTIGSILGSSWMCGKESEWEDLEDSTMIGLSQFANKYYTSIETQVVSSRKRSGQRWSRMMRKQRSRISKKDFNSSSKPCESTLRDDTSDDSTYESLHSFQPDDFCTDSEAETTTDETTREREYESTETEQKIPIDSDRLVIAYLEAPTRPNPPPPREVSLTRTLGKRIKMLRRTWSITKGSLGRIRKRTTVDDGHSCDESKEFSNDHSNLDGGRYFSFARHFKRTVTGPFSTFYLNGYIDSANGDNDLSTSKNSSEEPMYSNTNDEMDHYSVLVDQEPLYQFYAAAAARIASDFSSDDYEEVEGMIPSRSTTDLAKPGHRTLWCQTPQVINNGLLQRLSTEEKKVQEAKFEILTSEASYLNSLRVLKNEFLNEPSLDEILTPFEKDKLFGGIPSVLQASEQFLAELEAVWRYDPMLHGLPDVLLKYTDKCLDIYVAYCSNQVSIDTTLKDLRTRKGSKFIETISQIEARSTCQSLSLHSFLMLPMQRITRLPLLADAVLSKLPVECEDRSHWEKVLSSLSYVVAECNEGASTAAKEIEMENLIRKLEYSAKIKPIVLKGKHLVKSGPTVQLSTKADAEYKLTFGKRFNKTPLYLLLLTDLLLVAKQKSNTHDEMYTVIDTCKRSLIALEPVPEDSPFAGRNAMLLTLLENYSGHQIEYILTCESDTERQRWLEAVSSSKRGLPEETLYEVWDCPQVVALYYYSPNQPDELSLHPGDIINVFRKMSDGWYQGGKLLNGEQGWFPGNYTKEVASEHVRAKNLKQRHRFLTLSGNALQRRAKQQSATH
ncbi:ephexin isoform X3 [Bombus vancouverensis nearcticus]|uniref:ephexin isoform X3 n=1 Tax=Bombus vancouverensis nearcticus TaxID=2705178 RepID=UPI00402BB3A1